MSSPSPRTAVSSEREQRRKLRTELSAYYQLQERSQDRPSDLPSTGRPEIGSGGAQDIDSQEFDVQAYTTKLLKERSLKGLLDQDTELRKSIRHLDGELQTLVYDNYSKFISATDTIRQMRANVTEMDHKLRALNGNVDAIDSISTAISSGLHDHRAKIEEMIAINNMLKKIQFLVELPKKIRKALVHQSYSAAVKFWTVGDNILTKYKHVKSFQHIHADCLAVAQELYEELEHVVRRTSLDATNVNAVREAVENIRLLRSTSLSTRSTEEFNTQINAFLATHIKEKFNANVELVFKTIRDEFHTRCTEFSSMSPLTLNTKHTLLNMVDMLRGSATTLRAQTERALDIMGEENTPVELSNRVMELVQPVMVQALDLIAESTRAQAVVLVNRVMNACASSDTPWPVVAVGPLCLQYIEAFVKDLRDYCLPMTILGNEFLRGLHDHTQSFKTLLDQSVRQAFSSMIAFMEAFADTSQLKTDAERRAFSGSVLVLSTVARLMGRTALRDVVANDIASIETAPLKSAFDQIYRQLSHQFIILKGQHFSVMIRTSMDASNWTQKKDPTDVSPAVAALTEEWAATFAFISDCATKDERERAMTRTTTGSTTGSHGGGSDHGSTTGHGSTTRSGVSAVSGGVSTGAADSTSNAKYNPEGVGQWKGVRRLSYQAPSNFLGVTARSAMATEVDKMFAQSSTYVFDVRPPTIDAPHLMECAILYATKSFIECVRVKTFNKGGLQQIQVDVGYILFMISANLEWIRHESRVRQQVGEILRTVMERCLEPSLMQQNAVESIVKARAAREAAKKM